MVSTLWPQGCVEEKAAFTVRTEFIWIYQLHAAPSQGSIVSLCSWLSYPSSGLPGHCHRSPYCNIAHFPWKGIVTSRNILYPSKLDPLEDRPRVIHKAAKNFPQILSGILSRRNHSWSCLGMNQRGKSLNVSDWPYSDISGCGKKHHHFQQQHWASVRICDFCLLVWKIVLILSTRLNSYLAI